MKLTLNIEPRSLPRARHSVRGRFAQTYYTKDQQALFKEYEISIVNALKSLGHINIPIYDKNTSMGLKLTFYMPIPKSYSNKKRIELENAHHKIKPDIDNLIKMILDRASGKIWEDDYSISEITATKLYSNNPRIDIEITTFD